MADDRSVLARIAALGDMDLMGLRQQWRILFVSEPPGYGPVLMRRRLAYRIQELAYGGLAAETRERLRSIHEQAKRHTQPARPSDIPVAGTVLVREHDGVRHEVRITRDGFEYAGKTWKSLSVIARAITGVRWNGPAFFGLRSTRTNAKQKKIA